VVGGIGAEPIDLLAHAGDSARWPNGLRPVDLSFDACGRLLVSSDGIRLGGIGFGGIGSMIVRIERGEQLGGEGGRPGLIVWFYNIVLAIVNFVRNLFGQ